jgi:Na+-transporting NADH:ubiquinone oxidoreductase subunit C
MKKGYLYTVIFMAIVSIVFTGLLAGVNAAYKNKIKKNQETAVKSSILSSVGIEAEDADKVFSDKSVEKEYEGMTYYSIKTEEGTAYAIPFEGPGLWGTIRGYIGVSSDFTLIKGLAFTEQNETPGLGGRIDEDWYKAQFRGTKLSGSLSYGEDTGIDAITGATSTSNAVLNILNNFIETTLKELEEAGDE